MAIETMQNLIGLFGGHGDRPAIVAFSKDEAQLWSFAELTSCARRLAAGLSKAGIRRGDNVALVAPNSPAWVITCLALFDAGAVPVLVDAQMGREDLHHVLVDSGARWIVTMRTQAERVKQLQGLPDFTTVLLDAAQDDVQGWRKYLSDTSGEQPPVVPEDTAVLFYTSGTSGRPKGVPLSHRNLMSNLQALLALHLILAQDRLLMPLPLHHIYPFMVGMLAPLAAGIPILLPASLTGPQLLKALNKGQATLILGVPRLYEALYGAIETRIRHRGRLVSGIFNLVLALSVWLRRRLGVRLGRWLFASLRRQLGPQVRAVLSGGAALKPELAWRLEGLGWAVGSGYGLTETSPVLTFNAPGEGRIETAGRPLPGIELRIAEPMPPAEQGEVLARGPNVFSGYRHLPEKTQEAFTPDGFFRTGDLGYCEDGFLHLVGRASEMIVLAGGENIRPEYVEEVLNQGAHIQETGVLERDGRLVALIVPTPGAAQAEGGLGSIILADLKAQSQALPSHHRPSDYAITPDPLPRTHLGKIQRYQLEARYNDAKAQGEKAAKGAGPLPIERMAPEDQHLVEDPTARGVWQWLAKRFAEVRLTPDANFQLDLGVDSLEWLTLTLELREATGANLDEQVISRVQTVRDLLREAAEVGGGAAGGIQDPLAPLSRPEQLLAAEQRRWLERPGAITRALGTVLLAVDRWLMHRVFRLEAQGLEYLPERGPFVLTPNHVSYLDALALAAALPQRQLGQTYWAGYVGVMFRNVVIRLVSRAARVIPVDPSRGPLSSLALGVILLRQGEILVWFPERGRSETGKLQRFQAGIGILLAAQRVPVVPVWISGTHEALPVGSWWPRLRPLKVKFGPPAETEALEREAQGERPELRIAAALQKRVAHLQTG